MSQVQPAPSQYPKSRPLWWVARTLLAIGGLAVAAAWAWRQPFLEVPRTLWELSRMPTPGASPVPVHGVAARDVAATFGAPRSGGRSHAGVDIFAARGTAVVSATRGVVVSVRESGIGGRQAWVIGPARERHYYAHLDAWAPGLERGKVLQAGDAIGVVGDTGNARGTPTHLHYGIYGEAGAVDPLPRLRSGGRSTPGPEPGTGRLPGAPH